MGGWVGRRRGGTSKAEAVIGTLENESTWFYFFHAFTSMGHYGFYFVSFRIFFFFFFFTFLFFSMDREKFN